MQGITNNNHNDAEIPRPSPLHHESRDTSITLEEEVIAAGNSGVEDSMSSLQWQHESQESIRSSNGCPICPRDGEDDDPTCGLHRICALLRDAVEQYETASEHAGLSVHSEATRDQHYQNHQKVIEGCWNQIREWLEKYQHDRALLLSAAVSKGEFDTTPLHVVCRYNPPVDIVMSLLDVAPLSVQMSDSFGWLPLHYACANGDCTRVLQVLLEAHPESRAAKDNRGRTPLHFALASAKRPATKELLELLSSHGAAGCPDENGRLPIHYACLYGVSKEAMQVLIKAKPESVTSPDHTGRTPLHFTLSNVDKPSSPQIVASLLAHAPHAINLVDMDGNLPLHLLSTKGLYSHSHFSHKKHAIPSKPLHDTTYKNNSSSRTRQSTEDEEDEDAYEKRERDNAKKCLEICLHAAPYPTADFFTALQSLPMYLRDVAVVTPWVQHILNGKISRRFPTGILMADFYATLVILVCFRSAVREYINALAALGGDTTITNVSGSVPMQYLGPLYFFGTYFLCREVIQVISLGALGLFKAWLFDLTNILDVTGLFVVFFWTTVMHFGHVMELGTVRSGAAASIGILFLMLLSFLKSTLVDFAVFVGGVYYVVTRMVAFLVATGIILIAFALMFVTVFQGTPYCTCWESPSEAYDTTNPQCTPIEEMGNEYESYRPFCNAWQSLLKVYTMLLGEVSEEDFRHSKAASVLFVIFMFLVVILLANVLIAIVTDSYGVIKNQRAQIVFWSNRLDFVTEIDLIFHGPWRKKLARACLSCCCFLGSGGRRSWWDGQRGESKDGGVETTARSAPVAPMGGFSSHRAADVRVGGTGFVWNGESPSAATEAFREAWRQVWDLFNDQESEVMSVEFWYYVLLRLAAAIFIPLWVVAGFVSVGVLWPPQIRKRLFEQRLTKRKEGDTVAEQRLIEMNEMKAEVKKLRDALKGAMTSEQQKVGQMKGEVMLVQEELRVEMKEIRSEMAQEMKQLREIMMMLVDMQSSVSETS